LAFLKQRGTRQLTEGKKANDELTPKQRAFLAAYAVCYSPRMAARAAKVGGNSHFEWKRRNPVYLNRFREIQKEAGPSAEEAAIQRAIEGERKPVISNGKVVWEWQTADGEIVPRGTKGAKRLPLYESVKSDRMLELILKANLPEKYKDRIASEHSGPGGGPITQETRIVVIEDDSWYGKPNNSIAQNLPPASDASPNLGTDQPGTIQGGGLRPTLGEDG